MLVAVEYVGRKNGRTLWRCICDCGKESVTGYSNLMTGNTKSCGCMEKANLEYFQRHSYRRKSASLDFSGTLNKHPLYGLWSSMLTRCYNKNSKHYNIYGGRGIKVCDRWLPVNFGFEHFVSDMGERPSNMHTLDRINNDGDYCPENCRWATITQQSNNKRKSIIVYYFGKRIYLKELCQIIGLNYSRVAHQIQKGFDINSIISNGGADFRRKEFMGDTGKYKNFNKNITIFVPDLETSGTEVAEQSEKEE